jgi:hypothetical protein
MAGQVIWGDFESALGRRETSLLNKSGEAFGEQCPGMLELGGYLDGTLRGAAKDAVEEHLVECPLCRRLVVELYLVLKERRQPAPESLKRFAVELVPGGGRTEA